MRLACYSCDTDKADGVEKPPPGWTNVEEADYQDEPFVWWTHLGYCPECRRTEFNSVDEDVVY